MPELSNTVAVVTGGRIGLGRALDECRYRSKVIILTGNVTPPS